jgi:hypothetical protein
VVTKAPMHTRGGPELEHKAEGMSIRIVIPGG